MTEEKTAPATQRITLEMREPVRRILAAGNNDCAAQSFTSLFLWQEDMKLTICLREDAFAVRCGYWEGDCWFFPCGEREAVLRLVREILEACPRVRFLYLRPEDVSLLEEAFPDRFRVEHEDSASEYLYDREEYARMPGSRYQHIRWGINRLKRSHELRTEPLDARTADTARDLLSRWEPWGESAYFAPDHETAKQMLDHLRELGMTGVIVYVDGKPQAMAAGFPLSESSYDIAFSKALERERGLQFHVRRELIARLPDTYRIINGEEDLGIPGLRESKLQENPVGRIEMYSAYAR